MRYRFFTNVLFVAASLLVTPALAGGESRCEIQDKNCETNVRVPILWKIYLKSGQTIEFISNKPKENFLADYRAFLEDRTRQITPRNYYFYRFPGSFVVSAKVMIDWNQVVAVSQIYKHIE